jgi:hypothetical protein
MFQIDASDFFLTTAFGTAARFDISLSQSFSFLVGGEVQ